MSWYNDFSIEFIGFAVGAVLALIAYGFRYIIDTFRIITGGNYYDET